MKNAARAIAAGQRQRNPGRALGPDEYIALRNLRTEAHTAGAVLANAGRGGLLASLVLGVMRRDGFRCTVCGDAGQGDHGGLTVHHRGGVGAPLSVRLAKLGKANTPENLTTLCVKAHRHLHHADDALADAVDAADPAAEGAERVALAVELAPEFLEDAE